jgi:hypothetical protein
VRLVTGEFNEVLPIVVGAQIMPARLPRVDRDPPRVAGCAACRPTRPAIPLTGLGAVAGALVGLRLAGTPTTAAVVLAEAVGCPAPPSTGRRRVTRAGRTLDGVTGDLYDPGWRAPALVLLPGAAPKGRHDVRVQQVSRSLAGAGRSVFVPDLELSRTTFDRVDIDRVARAVPSCTRGTPGPAESPCSGSPTAALSRWWPPPTLGWAVCWRRWRRSGATSTWWA